jgi:hypothetical protein
LMGGLLGVSFQITFKSLTNKVGTFVLSKQCQNLARA